MYAFWWNPSHQRFWMSFEHCVALNFLLFDFRLEISNFPWLLPYFHRFCRFSREFCFQVVCSNDIWFLLAPLWPFFITYILFGSLFVSNDSNHFFISPCLHNPKLKIVHALYILCLFTDNLYSLYLFVNQIFSCISYNIIIHTFGSPILLLNTNHNALHCCCSDIVIVFLDNFQKKKKNLIREFYSERIQIRIVSPKRIEPNGLLSFQFGNEKALRVQK